MFQEVLYFFTSIIDKVELQRMVSVSLQDLELLTYLQQKLSYKDNQLFIVVPSDTNDWQEDESCTPSQKTVTPQTCLQT